MNKTIQVGLLLLVSAMGASACTSLIGGFDFDGGTGGAGATLTSTGGGGGGMPECTKAEDCADPAAECVMAACDGGKCGTAPVASGTAVATQTIGDCRAKQCDGKGEAADVNDDADLPDDKKACTVDACTAGVPSNKPAAAGTTCGNNLTCDGKGECTGCVTGTDCPGTDTACQTRTCAASVCGTSNAATATDLTANATATVTFANGNFSYAPKCMKVKSGTVVTFNGSFSGHPLIGGTVAGGVATPAASGPFVPVTNTGNTKAFTMSSAGTFPYYCMPHAVSQQMYGTIFVVP